MKVIFLKDVPGTARRDDIKNVADGHAQNFLFPKKFAEPATVESLARLEAKKKGSEAVRKAAEEALVKNLGILKDATVTLTEKATPEGHLFAGIHAGEILSALKKQTGVELLEEYIDLPKPIKTAGEHEITVLALGKTAKLKLRITPKE